MKATVGIWLSYVVTIRGGKIRIYPKPTKASLCRLAWLEVLSHNKQRTGDLRIFEFASRGAANA